MIQFLVFVTLLTFATSNVILKDNQWTLFKETYGKIYSNPEEEIYRKKIFDENLKKIEAHNEKANRGEHSYQLGITHFADLTRSEMKMPKLPVSPPPSKVKFHRKSSKVNFKVPDSVDWRLKGILTGVKDQGACPSCWAFTAAATIEAAYAQVTGKLVNLSVQNVLDCAPDAKGCEPGYAETAFYYAIDQGINQADCYPYESHDDLSRKACRSNSKCDKIKISDIVFINSQDENALRNAVAEHVVAVFIYADFDDFLFYKGGIFNSPDCRKDKITHMVAIVGYGTENGIPYWIFKNSWGEQWGEKGYGRLLRGNNTCGIVTYYSNYPKI